MKQALKALLLSKSQLIHKKLLDATHAILFFGTPHRGLHTVELEAMLDVMSSILESNRADLIVQLREGSEFLESEADALVDILSRLKVVSFYETVETPTVKKVNKTVTVIQQNMRTFYERFN